MKIGRMKNKTQGSVAAGKIRRCSGLFDRFRGLLGTRDLAPDEACWIVPCNSIHTFGMHYSIDAYFLDKKNQIVSVMENLKPNRISPVIWKAHSVLEFKSGTKRNIRAGDELIWEETP